MKSYFARLADRAMPAPQPAAPPAPAGEVSDPFAEVAPPLAAAPVPAPPQPGPAPHLTPKPPAPAPRAIEEPPPAAPQELPSLRPTPPERTIATTTSESPDVKFGGGQTPTELNVGREGVAAPPPKIAPPAPQAPPPAVQPVIAQSEAVAAESVEAVHDERREELRLLRKADAFMERLLDRSRRAEAEPRAEASEEVHHETLPLRPGPQPAVRIQPVERAPRPAESAPEPPSLVIGSLTVEVLQPPPPAPVSPRIVVARGARGARTGIRSSRSFGLRQF